MAEVYKGLTVRIGGDTTSLQKALQSVNSSISTTQTKLSTLRRALSLDPGNLKAIDQQIEQVGIKAVEAATKLSRLRSTLSELASSTVSGLFDDSMTESVEVLASRTADAAARAAEATKNYDILDGELKQCKDSIVAMAAENDVKVVWDEATGSLSAYVEELREQGAITDELASTYQSLNDQWKDAFDELQISRAVESFDELKTKVSLAESEVSDLTNRFIELTSERESVDSTAEALSRIDHFAELAAASLDSAKSSLEMDPTSVSALAQKMTALKESVKLASERTEVLKSRLSELKDAGVDKVADQIKDTASNVEAARKTFIDLSTTVNECEGHLADLVAQQANMDAHQVSSESEEYKALSDEINRATDELSELVSLRDSAKADLGIAEQVAEYNKLSQELVETEAAQASFNKALDETKSLSTYVADDISAIADAMMVAAQQASQYATKLLSEVVDATKEVDEAYRDLRKTVQGTEEDYESLKEAAQLLSLSSVTSSTELLEAMATGGELGLAVDSLEDFAVAVADIATATNLSAEDAATAIGTLMNICDDFTDDTLVSFSDALVRLGNNGASTETQIVEIAQRIAAVGSIMGLTTPEILAWASTIASTGQKSEAAGTAISNTMSDVESAVESYRVAAKALADAGDATSDELEELQNNLEKSQETLKAWADVAGMTADEFAAAWEETPSEALEAFVRGLGLLDENGGSAIVTLEELGISGVRQQQALLSLSQSIDTLDDNLAMSSDAWAGVSDEWGTAGDAADEASRKAEGFSGSVTKISNAVEVVLSELGDVFSPVLAATSDAVASFAESFVSWDDGTKTAILAVTGVTAVLAPLVAAIKGLSGLKKNITNISSALSTLSGAGEEAGVGISGLISQLGGLKTALVVGGVAVLAAGVAALWGEFQEAEKKAKNFAEASERLSEACEVADGSMQSASETTDEMAWSVRELEEATRESHQAMMDLAESFEEINRETDAATGQLDKAYAAIDSYAGRANLSSTEVGYLKAAVETLNTELGTNYEVAQDADGYYQVMTDGVTEAKDAIYELVEAQKYEVRMQAQMQKLSEAYEAQADAQERYAEALEAVNEAERALEEYREDPTLGGRVGGEFLSDTVVRETTERLEENVASARENLSELGADLNTYQDTIDRIAETIGTLETVVDGTADAFLGLVMGNAIVDALFGSDSEAMAEFAAALEDACERSGRSLDDLASLADTDIANLANAWANGSRDMAEAIIDLGIHFSDGADDINASLMSITSDEVLEQVGTNMWSLSEMLASVGVSAEQMSTMTQEQFDEMVAAADGDINALVLLLAAYNETPIVDKNGAITVDQTMLMDAWGNVYLWNGTELRDLEGRCVITYDSIALANGEVLEWNDTTMTWEKDGVALVEDEELESALGNILEWNGSELTDLYGNVFVGQTELTDALGNLVEYNGTELKTIEGEVYVDYSDVTTAISRIKSLLGYDGSVATTTLRVVTSYSTTGTATSYSSGTSASRILNGARMASDALAEAFAAGGEPAWLAAYRADVEGGRNDDAIHAVRSFGGDLVRDASSVAAQAARAAIGSVTVRTAATTVDVSAIVSAISSLAGHIDALELTLDTNKVVGGIAPAMNRRLGTLERRGALA